MIDCPCCQDHPMDSWVNRSDVPQHGTTYLQLPARELFKDGQQNQLVSIYVFVRYIGQPPRTYGGGVYEITEALGYPELIGRRYSFGYSSIRETR